MELGPFLPQGWMDLMGGKKGRRRGAHSTALGRVQCVPHSEDSEKCSSAQARDGREDVRSPSCIEAVIFSLGTPLLWSGVLRQEYHLLGQVSATFNSWFLHSPLMLLWYSF